MTSHRGLTLLWLLSLAAVGMGATTEPARPAAARLAAAEKRFEQLHAKAENGTRPLKLNHEELEEYSRLPDEIAGLQGWTDVTMPKGLDLGKLATLPESLARKKVGPTKRAVVLAEDTEWRLVGLMNKSMVAVPRAWEIYDAGRDAMIVFPVMGIGIGGFGTYVKPEKRMQLTIGVRDSKDFDTHYDGMLKTMEEAKKEGVKGTADMKVGPKRTLSRGAGYFTMTAPDGFLTYVIFVPAKGHEGHGYQIIAMTSAEKWKDAGPVFEALVTHWYNHDGTPLAETFKIDAAPAATRP